jgi:dihydrofolate synthase/folylpolyglutamate synthase
VVNAATAYTSLQMSGLTISEDAIRNGFSEVYWPCRFEIIQREPAVILDSAHNTDSFEKLTQTLDKYFPGKEIILIFGSSEDKDMEGMLATLKTKLCLILATKAIHPRATDPEKIIELANRIGVRTELAVPVEAALVRALEVSAEGNKIVVSAGSMFVTAEVKTAWEKIHKR